MDKSHFVSQVETGIGLSVELMQCPYLRLWNQLPNLPIHVRIY